MGDILRFSKRVSSELPILVLTGWPGNGKSRLIEKVTSQRRDLSFGLIDSGVISLPGAGCPSCAAREVISKHIQGFLKGGNVQYVILALPLWCDLDSVLSIFDPENEFFPPEIRGRAYIDAVVTLVDVPFLYREYLKAPEDEERPTEDFESLIENLEKCDVLAFTNGDAETPDEKKELVIRTLQPAARVVYPDSSKFSSLEVIGLRLFHFKQTPRNSGINRALMRQREKFREDYSTASHFQSFVYRRRRPFHPERLWSLLCDWPASVLRSWGSLWIATRDEYSVALSQSGPLFFNLKPEGAWLASLTPEELSWARESNEDLFLFWDENLGDKYTEIVFLPYGHDLSDLVSRLDSCLLTDLEMRLDWTKFPDPIPRWSEVDTEELPTAPVGRRPTMKLIQLNESPVLTHEY